MTVRWKLPALMFSAFMSVSCVADYGSYDEDATEEDEEDEDEDDDEDSDGLTGTDGGRDAGAAIDSGLVADTGASNDSGSEDDDDDDDDDDDEDDDDEGAAGDGGRRDGGGDAGRGDGGGADAGSDCADLTYETFGRQFMTTYCVGCHGAQSPRAGVRLDSLANVTMRKAGVKSEVLGGTMPQGSNRPSQDDRERLGQWIDCGPR